MPCSMGQDQLSSLVMMLIDYRIDIVTDDVIDIFCRKQTKIFPFNNILDAWLNNILKKTTVKTVIYIKNSFEIYCRSLSVTILPGKP